MHRKAFILLTLTVSFMACNGVFGPKWKERAGIYRASNTNYFELKADGTIIISTNSEYPLTIKNYNPNYRALSVSAAMALPLQLGGGSILFNFVGNTNCEVAIERNFKSTNTMFIKE